MKRLALIAALTLAASAARAESFFDFATAVVAKVRVGSTTFQVYVHPKKDELLLEAALGSAWSPGIRAPEFEWREIAQAFVAPLGCRVDQIRPMWRAGEAWLATYSCPAGVDLHALAKAQHRALGEGKPLKPADPQATKSAT